MNCKNGVFALILLTLLVDLLAAASYYVQRQAAGFYLIGLVLQVVFVIAGLIAVFGYGGKRRGYFNFDTWSRVFTLPYAFIVLSLIANGILAFLYYLNYSGANSLIFK